MDALDIINAINQLSKASDEDLMHTIKEAGDPVLSRASRLGYRLIRVTEEANLYLEG